MSEPFRLGDLCNFTKGLYPTLKTEPGEYPLVVTAAYRRTADSYQMEGPAVCIPLVSSTGHGDAALHRVHYQEGKFALANLLVALTAKDTGRLSAQYLYHLLMARKDDLLVPLMQGTANVSLKIEDIAGVVITLPPPAEQRRIVARIEELAAKIAEARRLRDEASEVSSAVIGAAMRTCFGDTAAPGWRAISDEVMDIQNGWSPACLQRRVEDGEWGVLKLGAVSFGSFDFNEHKALPPGLEPTPEYEIKAGDFLMSRANTVELVGACAVVRRTPPRLILCDKIFRFKFKEEDADLNYWDYLMKSPPLRDQIERAASGTSPTMKNISKPKIMGLRMPRHSTAQRQRIVAYLDTLSAEAKTWKQLQATAAAELDALLPSILHGAFIGVL